MAHLDCIREFTRHLAELMLQFGQILRTKTRTQLQHQWPKPIRERRLPLKKSKGFYPRVAKHHPMGDHARKFEAEPKARGRLRALARNRHRARQGIKGRTALDRVEYPGILRQVVAARRRTRVQTAAPIATGPDRTADWQERAHDPTPVRCGSRRSNQAPRLAEAARNRAWRGSDTATRLRRVRRFARRSPKRSKRYPTYSHGSTARIRESARPRLERARNRNG